MTPTQQVFMWIGALAVSFGFGLLVYAVASWIQKQVARVRTFLKSAGY